jgi:pyruvate dehydrogenase E2 component (dihydrolipoamide acetyltransferase)
MAKEFKLPAVSEGVESVDVAVILVKEGDIVKADQIVAEVETDKAVAELPVPYAGRVSKIHITAGQTVKIGTVIMTIEEGATADSAPAKDAPKADAAKKEEPKKDAAPAAKAAPAKEEPKSAPAPAAKAEAPATGKDIPKSEIAAGPATRRLARSLGVDIALVKGTGPGGRISQEDVQEYVRKIMSGPVAPSGSGGGGIVAPPLPDFSTFGTISREPLNKVGKMSAQNLSLSWNVIPHVTQHEMADITEIEAARKHFQVGRGKDGPKVTMTTIAIKAVVTALKAFPKFNSSFDPQTMEIVLKKYYNVGVAVDTENGLLVPVVKNVDKKTILEIAGDITELAGKARERKLSMDQMTGATFTITNLGGIGGTYFTPIVNYPEVAILGMSRGRKELVLVDGKPTERLMLPLSLSYDHRVINGADAARFIAKLSDLLSDPFTLLAEC